jgi:hypothetical protein
VRSAGLVTVNALFNYGMFHIHSLRPSYGMAGDAGE